jgi:hypothetical protein
MKFLRCACVVGAVAVLAPLPARAMSLPYEKGTTSVTTPDFSYLAELGYSGMPSPERPADTVLRALKDVPEGTAAEEVKRAARAFDLDVTFMEVVAKIESDFDPKQRTGSYVGLFQLSKREFDRYGSGEITDARDTS